MGDHYVPKAYLRGFCDANAETIVAYEKKTGRHFRSAIKNVAQEKGYYPTTIERTLANHVEGPTNRIIRKLQSGEPVSIGEKARLAHYIAVMMQRVPHHRERMKSMRSGVTEGVFKQLYDELEESRVMIPELSGEIDSRLAEARALQAEYRQRLPSHLISRIEEPWPSTEVVAAIATMTWQFGVSSGPSYFLTSDNPVFFFECWGVGRPQSEITFAVSTNVVLHASRALRHDLAYFPIDQQLVKEINRRTAVSATRFLFYFREEGWIETLARKERNARDLSRIVFGE